MVETSQLFYVVGIVVLMYFAFKVMAKVKPNETQPKAPVKPEKEIPNDKIILIENADAETIRLRLKEFCNLYNTDEYAVLPRFIRITDNCCAILFPFDDPLEIVCYLVNYIAGRKENGLPRKITAWATVSEKEQWNDIRLTGQKIMCYPVPEGDPEQNTVEIAAITGKSYRIALDSRIYATKESVFAYKEPPFSREELVQYNYEDME